MNEVKLEVYDEKDGFRIRLRAPGIVGEWVSCTAIARLTYKGVEYFAVTQYYDSIFPCEKVLTFQKA